MNHLPLSKQVRVVSCLVDGCSIRATERIAKVSRPTILKLLVRLGKGCDRLHNQIVQGVQPSYLQLDEIWSFIGKKQRRVKDSDDPSMGDSYTFTGMDANSKLMISYRVGQRDGENTAEFLLDLKSRVIGRPQITTDGFPAYADAIDHAFGLGCDYAQLVKILSTPSSDQPVSRRYSPGRIAEIRKDVLIGSPDDDHIQTSYIERQNLTARMNMRRFTRLTNAFSKKFENHCAAVSLHFAYYNLVRQHMTTRLTPAMAAGIEDHMWSLEELVERALAAADEPETAPPVPTMPPRVTVHRSAIGPGRVTGIRAEPQPHAQAVNARPVERAPWLRVIDGGRA